MGAAILLQYILSDVLLEDFRHFYRAVRLLVVLENGNQRAPHGKNGCVVHMERFHSAIRAFDAGIETARLKAAHGFCPSRT